MMYAIAQRGWYMNEELLLQLRNLLRFEKRKRVPLQLQTEAAECGLACLAMVSGFYGRHIDLITLRREANISSRGSNLASLIKVANKIGMASRPLALVISDLSSIKKPCILHWDFNHFIVLAEIKGDSYIIHDPATGRHVITQKELSDHFTGVGLELWPETKFIPQSQEVSLKTTSLFRSVVGLKSAIVKIFCLSLIIEFITLLMPVGTQMVMDNAIPASDRGLLTLICLSLLVMTLMQAGVSVIRAWIVMVMSTYTDLQWKDGLFRHLLSLPLSWFERRHMGDVQSRFSSLDTIRSTLTQSVSSAMIDGIMASGAFILLILYGGPLVWVVAAFTLVFVLLRLATWPRYRQAQKELLIKNGRAASFFTETLYAAATVRAQGLSEQRRQGWLNMLVDASDSGISLMRFDILARIAGTFIGTCDGVIILWLGISSVIDHSMTLGAFVAFSSFRGIFSERILSLTAAILQLRMLTLHNERIADIALSEPEHQKAEQIVFPPSQALSLRAENLSFSYDAHSPAVFRDFNFFVHAGESVAIVGPSGIGKTTLMKVLCGLIEAKSGIILLNDIDMASIGLSNYRQAVGCVLQEDRLLAGSLRQNITGFSHEVDEEWMIECARLSHVHDDIMALPMKYETLTGELGEGLSGGQKQRIFIARALYRRPGILFMDEATSHLDERNESLINIAVSKLNITRIIIAHRPSTIASASRVIMMG